MFPFMNLHSINTPANRPETHRRITDPAVMHRAAFGPAQCVSGVTQLLAHKNRLLLANDMPYIRLCDWVMTRKMVQSHPQIDQWRCEPICEPTHSPHSVLLMHRARCG